MKEGRLLGRLRSPFISVMTLGTAAGGVVAPWFFGNLAATGQRSSVFHGYLIAAALMLAAAGIEVLWGVKAERASLEEIASPLSAEGD